MERDDDCDFGDYTTDDDGITNGYWWTLNGVVQIVKYKVIGHFTQFAGTEYEGTCAIYEK